MNITKLLLGHTKKLSENTKFVLEYDTNFLKKIFDVNFSVDKNIDLMMCVLSTVIYTVGKDGCTIEKYLKNWGITDYSIHQVGKGLLDEPILIFGIFHIDGNLIVVFKGTNDIQDDYTDLSFNTCDKDTDVIPGKVHSGFYNVLFGEDRYKEIIKELNNYPDTAPIFITGHSLGGALASLLYVHLTKSTKKKEDVNLITFGCPRVGNSEFVRCIENSKRYVNGNDIIPHLPLAMICGYRQTGKEILLGSGTSKFSFWNWSIEEHFLSNYFKMLI